MVEVAPLAVSAILRLLVTLAVVALLALLVWAIIRAVVTSGRAAASTPPPGAPSSAQPRSQEPVIDVTATQPTSELAEVIRENNRLLREILEELRRRPEGPPPGSSEHLG
ncbi:hypothetical protein AMK68_00925 [candidate division KD3-62 bacterium DG_56]|uniref:Uncharacterized protein n=1 Tax=candidate division KD3-62 bacterium DG_56 TaxID=1704032 RepID=A0A0S7XQB0_9BACT|nr:MAG: hypothetical protein AMK68_00925 [candidate division KD3-62 bacterium DG_56]